MAHVFVFLESPNTWLKFLQWILGRTKAIVNFGIIYVNLIELTSGKRESLLKVRICIIAPPFDRVVLTKHSVQLFMKYVLLSLPELYNPTHPQ